MARVVDDNATRSGGARRVNGADRSARAEQANIPAGEQVSVVVFPPRRSLLDWLTRRSQEDPFEASLSRVFGRVPFHAWMKGGMLRMMPYFVSVR